MEVVLLQRVENLGQMGDVVTVKAGYARNFLIPRKQALRATKDNLAYFEAQRKVLEAANLNSKKEAEAAAAKMNDVSIVVIRQSAESGKLYGSVSARDVADSLAEQGYKVSREQVTLSESIKVLGLFVAKVTLHPEVSVNVTVNVARTEEEAKIQAERGASILAETQEEETNAASEQAAAPESEAAGEEAAA